MNWFIYHGEDMRKLTVEAIRANKFKNEVTKLTKKYGKVVIVFNDGNGHRRRLLKDDGTCTVSYKSSGYRRWSKYDTCCFMSYTDDSYDYHYPWGENNRKVSKKGKKKTLKNTIDALVKHDDGEILPTIIYYGKTLKKKIVILSPEY
jgi:hypothetical protein